MTKFLKSSYTEHEVARGRAYLVRRTTIVAVQDVIMYGICLCTVPINAFETEIVREF